MLLSALHRQGHHRQFITDDLPHEEALHAVLLDGQWRPDRRDAPFCPAGQAQATVAWLIQLVTCLAIDAPNYCSYN